jgi:cytochrome bd-type quinol oxidase subunit 2
MPRWPLALIASPAAVAVWSGWVGLGGLCGFGEIHPLPGIWDSFRLNTAITLPIGIESYGAYALAAWLVPGTGRKAREFAGKSAVGALGLGMAGQVAYHLLAAAHAHSAPWWVTTLVSCLPVATLALATALTHLLRTDPTPATRADSRPGTGWPPGTGCTWAGWSTCCTGTAR